MAEREHRRGSRLADFSIGLAGIGLPVIGLGGVILAILGVFGGADVIGPGLCLIASAVALGMLLRALTSG